MHCIRVSSFAKRLGAKGFALFFFCFLPLFSGFDDDG